MSSSGPLETGQLVIWKRINWRLSFGIEDSVAHAANLRRGIYVGKLQPAWRPFCRFLAVSG